MIKRMYLNGSWDCRGKDGKGNSLCFTGEVPGCVHTDLIRNKIIDYDIFWEDNNSRCRWIEDEDFTYSRSFALDSEADSCVLVFEGLDTYCDIYVNERLVGSTDNMFIRHEFAVDGYLNIGENTVKVVFHSVLFFFP